MSHSSSLPEHSPDESGYFTSLPRRNRPIQEETDPSEGSDAATPETSVESSLPAPPPIDVAGPSRGPRTMRTARKRVLPPRRVTLSVPSGPPEELSQSRSRPRSEAPPSPAIGVPVPQPRGMTRLESYWVTGMASEVELHRGWLISYQQFLDNMLTLLNVQDEFTNRVMEVALDARLATRRMRTYLAWMVGAMVTILGLLIWVILR